MNDQSALQRPLSKQRGLTWVLALVAIAAAMFSTPLLAQQTGEIVGRVSNAADNSALSGVTIEATSPVLPGMRSSTTSNNGDYRLPLLPPGTYTMKFMVNDTTTLTRVTNVRLEQRSVVNLVVDLTADASY
ncbi:MAG: carboxypeptidase regulatory-like domain-containing protein, partial [Xanthomonadales bacterium]|nr:carboxypeptidase-like regulatory domain-containing protein [Gammaproteobacteria bacterium]NNK05286.1 carboxypeptidase regulatory-like domain-containing protein [Xanthomonadales bacterium]